MKRFIFVFLFLNGIFHLDSVLNHCISIVSLLKIRGLDSKTQMLVKYAYNTTLLLKGLQHTGSWLSLQHFSCYNLITYLLDNSPEYDLRNRKEKKKRFANNFFSGNPVCLLPVSLAYPKQLTLLYKGDISK